MNGSEERMTGADAVRFAFSINEWDDAAFMPAPCKPIACDAGTHLPRCFFDYNWEVGDFGFQEEEPK